MNQNVRAQVLKIFNFHPESDFKSYSQMLAVARRNMKPIDYDRAAAIVAEVLAESLDIVDAEQADAKVPALLPHAEDCDECGDCDGH